MTHAHREPDARETSIMAIPSRSLHQSQYCMQDSTRRDCDVVYRKQHISKLEEERLPIMAPRKSYASTTPTFVPINSFLDFQLVREKAFCGARVFVCFCDREFIFWKVPLLSRTSRTCKKLGRHWLRIITSILRMHPSAASTACWHLFSFNSVTTLTVVEMSFISCTPRVVMVPNSPAMPPLQDV